MGSIRSGTLHLSAGSLAEGSTINGGLKASATFLLALLGLVPIAWRRAYRRKVKKLPTLKVR